MWCICKDRGDHPLFMACQKGHLDIVTKLTEHNVDIIWMTIPFYLACLKGHHNISAIVH